MKSENNLDFKYVTKAESRDFHSRRRAFVIYNNELLFIEPGNSMSHWEFCLNKLNLTKDNFNKLTRGYYLNGDIVFYKDNFTYDDVVIKEGIKYINQIKNALNIDKAKIYFGFIVGNPGENWPYEFYYGDSLANNKIIRNS